MRFSALVERVGAVEDGAGPEAWALHMRAADAAARGETVGGAPIIVMSVGDPDLETPRLVKDAGIAAIEANDTHYAAIAGKERLRRAVAERFARRVGGDWSAENVIISAGAQSALFSASMCLFGPGDAVAALEPSYVTYGATIGAPGAEMVKTAAAAADGFRPTRVGLEAALSDRTRAILFATPNNPTGVMLSAAELEMIAAIAIERDLWVVADEVYADIGFDRPHLSIAGLPGMAERTVTIGSLSKSHAMTGWRVGWAIGPAQLIRHMENLAICMLYGLPGYNQEAAIAALSEEGLAASAEMREIYRRRRDRFVRLIAEAPPLVCATPEGGMFGLVDVRGTGLAAAEFCERLYAQQGVATLAGDPFGPSAKGFVRVSFALSEAAIVDACERIAAFVRTL